MTNPTADVVAETEISVEVVEEVVSKKSAPKKVAPKKRASKKTARKTAKKVVEPVVEAANPMDSFSKIKPDWIPNDERRQEYHLKMTPEEVFATGFEFGGKYEYLKFEPFPGAFQLDAKNKAISIQVGRAVALLMGGLWKVLYQYEGVQAPEGSFILRNESENRLIIVYSQEDENGRGPIARVQEYHFGDKIIQDEQHKALEPHVGWAFHGIENRTRRLALKYNKERGIRTWVCAWTKYHVLAKFLMAKEQEWAIKKFKEIFGDDKDAAAAELEMVMSSGDEKAIANVNGIIRRSNEATGVRLMGFDRDGLQHGLLSELWIVSGMKWEEFARAQRTFS